LRIRRCCFCCGFSARCLCRRVKERFHR